MLGRSANGPDLARQPSEQSTEFLLAHFGKPTEGSAQSLLTTAQKLSLAKLVTQRDDRVLATWENPPNKETVGAMLFQERGCGLCHTVNGSGAKNAPILNGLAGRREREWVEGHFGDPRKFSPNSQMPPYKFKPEELDAITSYLMEIPK